MKVQPEAHNAISIELDNGQIFRLHHTLHGDIDYLFITNYEMNNVVVEVSEELSWQEMGRGHMIRIYGGDKQ